MNKQLRAIIKKAAVHLTIERSVYDLQRWVCGVLIVMVVLLIVSRVVVWAYYQPIMIAIALVLLCIAVVWQVVRRVRMQQALHLLDTYYPHNELVTSMSVQQPTALVATLQQRAVQQKDEAYAVFTKHPKRYVHKPALVGSAICMTFMTYSMLVPASTQQQARAIEQEQAIVKEMEEVVEVLLPETTSEEQQALEALQATLQEQQLAEQALAELVKKQKELQQAGASEAVVQQLQQTASDAQSALSAMGKPIQQQLASAITGETLQGASSQSSTSSTSSQSTTSQQNGQTTTSSQQQQQAGAGQGNGNGQGTGQAQGQGAGSGNGTGTGKTPNTSNGGQGQGASLGKGDRNLITPADRFGEQQQTTVDGGDTAEGEGIDTERGNVNAIENTPIAYEAAMAQYEGQYLQQAEQLELPANLQQVVQHYFSTIQQGGETNE
ncbi:hypothetical protein [Caryophanon tenue]|uniref:Uncharacterized protein n=1 Tax=Caryophanon tenue TaxID=33978 RepID=A0A1C0YK09_9BACL|nr:hypothetical protein [Caryophanon tenue]OCS87517.1 hypothetical protein A6M13_09430 [Caryophanon tenue]